MRFKAKIFFVLVAALLVFRLDAWAQPTGAGAKPSERATGAITGRVINSAGEPLSGASVSAGSLTGARSQTATANNNGEFKIDGLDPGLYRLFAGMTGYVSSPASGPNDTAYYRIGDSVTLTLIKGAVITGTVTGPNGPLVGVGVFVTRVRDEEGKKLTPPITLRERSTDDRGMFRFYAMPPGAYLVWAARPRIGVVIPSAYDNDTPTYFPSSTRDTAAEITVRDGDEATTDIQYRAEPGHAVSGRVSGIIDAQVRFSPGATISLIDVQSRTSIPGTSTNPTDNHSFAMYGVPDGDYELSAFQYLQTGDGLRSPPQKVSVRGGDVTGLSLTLAALASIEGRLVFENDPKVTCAKRKETAAPETIVKAWRAAPEKPDAKSQSSDALPPLSNAPAVGAGDAKGSFLLRNLQPGNYRIDSQPPDSGWYLKSIVIGNRTGAVKLSDINPARDGISVKSGDRVTGLLVTITEGASRLRGRISAGEGQSSPPRMAVYLVPAEPGTGDNVLRFFETRSHADGSFTLSNVAPGRFWIVARQWEESESGTAKSIRQDAALRAKVLKQAEALKKAVVLKPCEQLADFDLPYAISPSQQ